MSGPCQDPAFEGVLLEFNMQFVISLKLFIHICSFCVGDKTVHKSAAAPVTDIVISKNYAHIPQRKLSKNNLVDLLYCLITVMVYIPASIFNTRVLTAKPFEVRES